MSGFLLDTNILSEIRKESHCDSGVRAWIDEADSAELLLNVAGL